MHAAGHRLEFAPPQPPGMLRAFVLAVIAHLLLLLALTYGLRWQRDTPVAAAQAELWSKLPQEAAPKVQPPPPAPVPVPVPPPVVKAPPLPDPQVQRDAEIALEREREKREAAQRRQEELERERDRKRKLEAQHKREEELARQKQEKLEQQEKLEKQEQARLQAEAKRKEDEKKKRLQEQQEKRLAQLREENMRRIQGMAGSGAPGSAGTAARSSGPSASWAGKVQARVRPNIVFSEDVSGNPKAEVEVRTSPDGTIVGKKLVRSSGSKAWDDAVLRALDKTETLPRDTDGRVPSPVIIDFRPKG